MRLSFDEIRFITVVVLILLVGTLVKHYRTTHPRPPVVAPATPPPEPFIPAGY
jgi:hypothetical protein